jgi:glycine/D-amino acid oxidase-like deaminating enzyme/nitrite reductase/ring-hydroxylating ferredoxin subunit
VLIAAQQPAQHMVVDRGDHGGEAHGVQRVETGERLPQILLEETFVPHDRDDLALAERGHLAHDDVATAGEFGVGGEVLVDAQGCVAHGQPRVRVVLTEERAQLLEHHLMIGEDHIVFAAELTEEGRPRDTRRLRDLLDGGLVEPLRREQLEGGGDDRRASPCGGRRDGDCRDVAHAASLHLGPTKGAVKAVAARSDDAFTRGMDSLWKSAIDAPVGTPLEAGAHHDVVIVGAGITGLTTGLMLARQGLDVAIVEAGEVGELASGANTGKISLLQGTVLSTLRRHHPASLVRAYVDANRDGAEWLRAFIAEAGVPLSRRIAYSYAQSADGVEAVRAESAAAAEAGLPVRRVLPDEGSAPFPFVEAIALDDQAAIDPFALLVALANAFVGTGGTLHTHARVTRVHTVPRAAVDTAQGRVSADNVVLATAAPITDRGLYFAKTRGLRSYCAAFDVDGELPDGLYLSVDGPTRSIRSITTEDGPSERARLIVGGNGHAVGRAASERALVDDLTAWTVRHFAGATPVAAWSAQDYESHDLIPFVGAMPRGIGRVRFATGYAKWGLTNGPAAALRLSAEIRRQPWRDRPEWMKTIARRMTVPADLGRGGVENLRVGWEATSGWVDAQRTPVPVPQPRDGEGVVAHQGMRPVAVSTVDGQTRAVSAVCTHMGGVLSWNDAECTWDCPLHASRFRPNGERIEGPATRDLDRLG